MPRTTSDPTHTKAVEQMRHDELDEVARANPNVDPTAIERSRQAVKQLADAGIEIGGYHLAPALGGATTAYDAQNPRAGARQDAGAEAASPHRRSPPQASTAQSDQVPA